MFKLRRKVFKNRRKKVGKKTQTQQNKTFTFTIGLGFEL